MNKKTQLAIEIIRGNICVECGNIANENLRKWFKDKWVNIGKKDKESATRRKRAAQNKANRGGKQSAGQGKKPIYVSTKPKK